MSDAREQSYYEIALTNRQVMSIFIVLLVCLLASFVSGVWIGRQGSGARAQVVDARPVEGGTASGETPVGEMGFFSGGGGDSGDSPASQPAPATEPEPPVEPPPAAAGGPDPVEPTPANSEPTPAAPAPGPQRAAPADGEFLYIQVFSGLDRQQAQSVVQRLKNGGYAAFLSSVEVDNRLMHRVRIGPYSQRQEAEDVAGKVRREFKLSTWITR